MDGSNNEHSDSDSGESWTLLENTPVYADDAPVLTESPTQESDMIENNDKDDDTDGISIITDSEHETVSPSEVSCDRCLLDEGNRPTDLQIPQFVSANSQPPNKIDIHHESVRCGEFFGDGTGKLKTYVHRRNKRLSTVLNIIVLGSVITAAGVAIGHMWGAKNECTMHTTPSVNKILSNLYKLQEENAYLRNKLKEITLVTNFQMQQRKTDTGKRSLKHNKCKKVFEQSLNNKNVGKLTKCVDYENNSNEELMDNFAQPESEKEFLKDLDKLKNVYLENKGWLDDEITNRIKHEQKSRKLLKHNFTAKDIKHKTKDNNKIDPQLSIEKVKETTKWLSKPISNYFEGSELNKSSIEKKITYADSLKSEHNIKRLKRGINQDIEEKAQEYAYKKKTKKVETDNLSLVSEEEFKKDDRYTEHKHKQERKKHDRQKIHKKQKRKNKYEQWEMKGGYIKDYDDFSISSQDNEFLIKNADNNHFSQDFDKKYFINDFVDIDSHNKPITENKGKKPNQEPIKSFSKFDKGCRKHDKDGSWYDKRATLRSEARKKLEMELFGETSPNNASWYFRRMQKREQCRAKGDNSTYRKLLKRNMNFKIKH